MWNFPEVVTEEFVLLGLTTPAFRRDVERSDVRLSTKLARHLHDRWAKDEVVAGNFGSRDVF